MKEWTVEEIGTMSGERLLSIINNLERIKDLLEKNLMAATGLDQCTGTQAWDAPDDERVKQIEQRLAALEAEDRENKDHIKMANSQIAEALEQIHALEKRVAALDDPFAPCAGHDHDGKNAAPLSPQIKEVQGDPKYMLATKQDVADIYEKLSEVCNALLEVRKEQATHGDVCALQADLNTALSGQIRTVLVSVLSLKYKHAPCPRCGLPMDFIEGERNGLATRWNACAHCAGKPVEVLINQIIDQLEPIQRFLSRPYEEDNEKNHQNQKAPRDRKLPRARNRRGDRRQPPARVPRNRRP